MDKKAKRLIITFVALVVLIAGAYVVSLLVNDNEETYVSNSTNNNEEPKKTLAPDFTVQNIDGEDVSLSDYRGKYVILNFWGSWCKYCIQEMPDFSDAQDEFDKENDTVILALNATNTESSKQSAVNYINKNNFNLTYLFDLDGSVSKQYNISGYPTTFVIDKEGYVYGYQSGMLTKEVLIQVIDELREGE